MMSSNEDDPFLQVQADVLSQLNGTRALFTSYLRIRSLSTTTGKPSPELASAHKELSASLTTLAEDLADLVESVKAVQDDPYKYGLEVEEVSRRKRLVDEVGDEVADMREELSKSVHAEPGGYKTPVVGPGDSEEQRDYNEEFEHEQQLTMMREQDQDLDGVFRTVGNLRQQADDMGRELEEQVEILETVDNLADRVGGRLQGGLKKMGEVVRKNEDGLSSCCIAVLIFVLILLLVLLLVL